MKLELATQNDFDAIIAFYDDVTERTPKMATYARWSKRKHPTIESIKVYTVQKTRSRSHRLDISIRYTFNAQKSKYKGTGAGKAEQQRMSNSNR